MKKAKDYVKEITDCYNESIKSGSDNVFIGKMQEVFMSIAFTEVKEMKELRGVKTDNGIKPIFKEQRNKYISICREVNKVAKCNLLVDKDFDNVIQELYPNIYDWYLSNVAIKN